MMTILALSDIQDKDYSSNCKKPHNSVCSYCDGIPKLINKILGNYFTYVTKSCPNFLSTYSRKRGNYNGTVIFEVDIMYHERVLPNELKYLSSMRFSQMI